MPDYWIHFTPVGTLPQRHFGIIEAASNGRQKVITPAGRLTSKSGAMSLLLAYGADAGEAEVHISSAMREGVSRLTVGEWEE